MSEELKVIIKAEIAQFKKGIDDAKKAMGSFKQQVKNYAKDANSTIKKMGDGIAKVGKTIGKAILAGTAAAGAGVIALGKKALDCYGDYEQLVGGIETLFKDSSGTVMQYAKDAYKNQQMSANQYMEIATGFSASLLQGLGGDTAEAARVTDMAITDMADNANKMGSSMESIQNAYQGFAKQNYTMLDNLKLGYGGTKEEMERLLADAEKLTGVHYDISNLNEVYEAIHVVQTELGITGTSALEAATTIQGSVATMKSAWTNWVTGLMDDNADIKQLTTDLIGSVKQVIENIAPRVKQFFSGLTEGIHEALVEYPEVQKTFDSIVNALKKVKDIVSNVISFVINNWGTIKPILEGIAIAVGVITVAVEAYNVVQAIKTAMEAAEVTTLGALISAQLASAAATLVALAPYIAIVAAIAAVIAIIVLCIKHWDDIKAKIVEVASAIWEAIKSAWDWVCNLLSTVAQWIYDNVIAPIVNFFTGLWETLKGIWEGICNVVDFAIQLIASIIDTAVQILLIPWNFIWENFGSKIVEAWESFKRIISDALTAISTAISNAWKAIKDFIEPILQGIADFFTTIWDAISTTVKNAVDKVKTVIETVFNAIKSFVETVWNAIKEHIIQPITNAVETVKQKFEDMKQRISDKVSQIRQGISDKFQEIKNRITQPITDAKNAVSNIFDNIKSAISSKINAAKDTVKGAIDKIKSFFNFSWSLPKLKMPHVSITGKFSLMPPSVPKFSIDWYAKGGVFDAPTLFSNGGKLSGLGEAGAEAIVPLENNTKWLDKIADKLASKMGNSGPIIMEVDGKTFAEISVDSINALTRQRGGLAINLV